MQPALYLFKSSVVLAVRFAANPAETFGHSHSNLFWNNDEKTFSRIQTHEHFLTYEEASRALRDFEDYNPNFAGVRWHIQAIT